MKLSIPIESQVTLTGPLGSFAFATERESLMVPTLHALAAVNGRLACVLFMFRELKTRLGSLS